MTLVVVPARIFDTVTTAGSKTSTRRVTIAWMAVTISHATGIGSQAWCGIDAWPPRPVTVMVSSSAEASSARPRVATMPDGITGVWWMANAIDTGSPPSAARSSRPSSSMCRAPWWPSSPGWNMNTTRPARSPRWACSRWAAPASMATWASWPQACMASSTVLA